MRTMLMLAAVIAIAVPAAAVAGRPTTPNPNKPAAPGKAAPKVMYVLRGMLSGYTAASGATAGSITIAVAGANHHGSSLKGQPPLTLPVSSSTKIVLDADGQITDGEQGIVKVRAAKRLTADQLVAALQTAGAWQVIDKSDSSDTTESSDTSD